MDPLPPDPYKALGVAKDAEAALIKSTYRKLALKCHPDKVTDESLKAEKQEEFHKIQQAYELIGDAQKRGKYDAEVRLDQLRREKLARNAGAPSVDVKTGRYEVRTQAPSAAAYSATTAHRYDEHKSSSRSYDDRDWHHEERSSRKYDTYEAYPKQPASRSPREKEVPLRPSRAPADRTRSDRNKVRDKEDRRDRERKFVSVDSESSSDEKARYEADYRRRSEDARKLREEDEVRRQAAEKRRVAEDQREQRRSYDEYDRQRKLSEMENDAVRYIHRSKVEAERPSPSRTSSSRDVRPDYYESRSSRRDPRPEPVRRSSARPTKDRQASSGRERDRKGPQEIVDWEEDRKVPSFKQSSSSPADLHVPRATPQRSYTESSREHRRTETSPTPSFRRSETMPSVPHTSSARRKEATPARPSTLRESVTPHDSGASSPEQYPTVPPPSSSKKYYYPTRGGGVSLSPEDMGVANGHRTIVHEPGRRARSPSPMSRPPIGANRPSESTVPKVLAVPPPLNRSSTVNMSSAKGEDRGRDPSRLYGEINKDHARRDNARRQTNFSPEQVSYSSKYGPEDVRWSAPRGRDSSRDEYAKPTLARHATYVY